jgi:hypothetical protein
MSTTYTKRLDFKPIKKGDTWLGCTLTINRDITGWAIRMWLRDRDTKKPVKEFTIGNGITIVNAANGVFSFPAFKVQLPASVYVFDIEFTDDNDVTRTYLKGTFTVIDDVTKLT